MNPRSATDVELSAPLARGDIGCRHEQRNVSLFLRLSFCPSTSLVSAISRLVSDFCR